MASRAEEDLFGNHACALLGASRELGNGGQPAPAVIFLDLQERQIAQIRLEWTPRLRQRVRGTVVVGCCGLYSSKVKREALRNRRSGHELCWRATHEGIAG